MKALPAVLFSVVLGFGCAAKRTEPTFQSVPGPSKVDPSLGRLASETGAKVYAEKEATTKSTKKEPSHSAKQKEQLKSESPIVTPDAGLTGKVAVYNEPGRFVVLNFPIGQMPKTGTRLFVYRNSLKVGEVKVTGPQRDDNIVADLVSGEARPADEIRDR
jgi:hypothetical protein